MKLLDLFAGAGGCSVGYQRAGFTVTAVDIDRNAIRRNPADVTMVADAMDVLADAEYLATFDAVHASPPCQAYSIATSGRDRDAYPDLLAPVIDCLREWRTADPSRLWIVENVPGAPFPPDVWTVEVCGAHRRAFDALSGRTLRLRRHRVFAVSHPIMVAPCACDATPVGGSYGAGPTNPQKAEARRGGYTPPIDVQRQLLGVEWMTGKQTHQAIPPDYTETIGRALLDTVAAP